MRKSVKLAILVAALVALCSMAALAADTWKQEGDQWFCYDSDGNPYYGAWKKSGSNYYYLDDATGAMVTNQLVETDGEKYWCGEDGARVLKKWVQVPVENDTDGYEWMFFKAVSGKAMVSNATADDDNSFQSVTNAEGVTRKYLFDSNGYMLYGYLENTNALSDCNVVSANYYCGPKSEGWQYTGWLKFVDGELEGDYADTALVYFYFYKGAKYQAADGDLWLSKKIDGKYYYFAEDGHLFTGYQFTATDADGDGIPTSAVYLGAADDGVMKKKVWVKTNEIEGTGDSSYWYYLNSDGNPTAADTLGLDYNAQIKKVNGKYYLFDTNGRMLTGLVKMFTEDDLNPVGDYQVLLAKSPASVDTFKGWELDYANGQRIYYFSTDSDNDGSMKTGTQTVTVDGEEVVVYLDKHGVAYEGVKSSKIYNNGVLQAAGDSKYAIKTLNTKDEDYYKDYYLVNAAGTIISKAKVQDSDGIYWVVDDIYTTYKFADKDYAANAATAVKNAYPVFRADVEVSFKIGSTEYFCYAEEAKEGDGYYFVNWTTTECEFWDEYDPE